MINCPVCDSPKIIMKYHALSDVNFNTTDAKFNMSSCESCEALFQNPQIDENEVGKYYPQEEYQPFAMGNTIPLTLKYDPRSIYLRILSANHKKEDYFNLLDLGCGGGTFLKSVRYYFPNCVLLGVDLSVLAVENLRKSGIDAICNSLYKFETDIKFDYVVSSQVLEHVNFPQHFFEKIEKVLKPSGKVMLDTPNYKSFSSKKFTRNWVHLDMPRHCILFCKENISIAATNFDTEEIRFGGSPRAILSSYKIAVSKNIHKFTLIESLILKAITPFAKIFNINALFNDKIIWIGKLK